jgi:hypothetical protein
VYDTFRAQNSRRKSTMAPAETSALRPAAAACDRRHRAEISVQRQRYQQT